MWKRVCSWMLGAGLGLWLMGCPPTLYINKSFRQAVTVPLAAGMVSLDRGESIELKEILKVEKKKPAKVVVTQLFGVYFLTAEGFQYVWRIASAGREKGSFTKIAIVPGQGMVMPKLQHSESHNCIALIVGAAGAEKRYMIHHSGQVGGKCTDVSSN